MREMPEVRGTVAGRIHPVEHPRAERAWIPFDFWEIELVMLWKKARVGDERIALRLMRPVEQIVDFDPLRPNGRRR